jgi:hypothetical protein
MTDIYSLLYHLKSCPEYFLQFWALKRGDVPHTDILLKDMYRRLYGDFSVADESLPSVTDFWRCDQNQFLSIQVACWFFHYPLFTNRPNLLTAIHEFLKEDLVEVSRFVKARDWVEDDDRAEEFIRLALKRCEIIPAGETETEAADKLEALDTLQRQEVLRESHDAYERMREIRRQMAEKKAREAANVYGRE